MSNVIQLKSYRQNYQRDYLRKNSLNISSFIENFVSTRLSLSLESLIHDYKSKQLYNMESSWDYLDLRNLLIESLEISLGEKLSEELKKEKWYDERFFKLDYALEKCLQFLILTTEQKQNIEKIKL